MWAREHTKDTGGYGFTKNKERFLRSYRVTSKLHMAVGLEVLLEPRFWRAALPVGVQAGEVDRLDEPVLVNLELERIARKFGTGRFLLESLRVVEVDDAGNVKGCVTAQFEPEERRAVFTLPGRTPKGAVRKFLLPLDDREGAHSPPSLPKIWDKKRSCAETPFYKAVLREGMVSDLHIKVGKEPERSVLWAIMFSSGETGWAQEEGEVKTVKFLTNGPVKAVVFVRKKLKGLKGEVIYEKTYEFYPRHFVISPKVNRNPGACFFRLFLLRPCIFEDSGGAKANVDGFGADEGVHMKTRSPRWFSLHSPDWALSCCALSKFEGVWYLGWREGVGRDGPRHLDREKEGKVAFVVHPGKEEASFAALDVGRLISPPPVVSLKEPRRP